MAAMDAQEDLSTLGMVCFAPYLMNRLMHRYNQTLLAKINDMGLSVPKMRALAALAAQDELTVNELTAYAVSEQSTMSRMLDQMERDDLISRRISENDSRARRISLTPAGWQASRDLAGDAGCGARHVQRCAERGLRGVAAGSQPDA